MARNEYEYNPMEPGSLLKALRAKAGAEKLALTLVCERDGMLVDTDTGDPFPGIAWPDDDTPVVDDFGKLCQAAKAHNWTIVVSGHVDEDGRYVYDDDLSYMIV